MRARPPARSITALALSAITVVASCGHDQARDTERSTPRALAGATLPFPDSTDCDRPNDVPVILRRDSLRHYVLNLQPADSGQLAEWVRGPFHQRPNDARFLLVNHPETFSASELATIVAQVHAAGGRIYAINPACVPAVP